MNNKHVCPKCGQIYDTELSKCPLCGAAAPQVPAETAPERRASERPTRSGGKYLSRADKKALRKEEEKFLRDEEARHKRMKKSGDADPVEDETDTRIPAGFIVASVLLLLAALVIGGSFLLWKNNLLKVGIYDRLSGRETEVVTELQTTEASAETQALTTTATETTVSTESTETEATEPPVVLPFDYDLDDPVLVLVNEDNPLPDDYEIADFAELGTGAKVSRLCIDALQEMADACRADKHYPSVVEGYDDHAKNTSEYCTGLALDIFPDNDATRDVETQKESETLMWLWEHSWEYGFIIRYPEGKEDITGHDFEPWHFRYVGKDVAEYMHENDLCFEEMSELLRNAG